MFKNFTFVLCLAVFILPQSGMASSAGGACTPNGAVEREGGQTLICNAGTWAAVMTHDAAGQTLLRVGVDAGACTMAKHGQLNFNGSVLTICDAESEMWEDVAPASGGGGSVTWAGATPTTYNGALGGVKGAHEKCHAAFPGSRMMDDDDLYALARTLPVAANGAWMYSKYFMSTVHVSSGVGSVANNQPNCNAFQSGVASRSGGAVLQTAGISSVVTCDSVRPIACVYD